MPRPKDFDEEEVLEKAMYLFWKEGYKATSIATLCEKLDISRSSLYITFKSKEILFLKALERYQKKTSEIFHGLKENQLATKAILSSFFQMIIEDILQDPDKKGCFMVNTATELAAEGHPEAHEFVNNNQQKIEAIFEELIRKGQSKGEISPEKNAQALARFYFNVITGLRVIAKVNQDREALQDIIEVALSVL